MTTTSQATSCEQTLHAALELSKNSWLLAIQVPPPSPVADGLNTH